MLIIGTDTVEFTDVNGQLITVRKPYKNAPVIHILKTNIPVMPKGKFPFVLAFNNKEVVYQEVSAKDTLTIVPQYQLN